MQIKNLTSQIQIFNIPCRVLGCNGVDCFCSIVRQDVEVKMGDGKVGRKTQDRRMPGALTILAKETKEVPDWVANTRPIKDAVARKVLRLVQPKKK